MKHIVLCCVISLVGIFAACKKKPFTYTKVNMVSECTLCELADSISGTYKGIAIGYLVPNNEDTMYVTLEHVFLNQTPELDSSVMFFNVQSWYASGGNVSNSVATLQQANGEFWNNGNSAELQCLRVDNDTLFLMSNTPSSPWNGSVFVMSFKGVKQ